MKRKWVKFVLEPSEEFPARVFGDTVSDDKTVFISLRYELKFSNLVSNRLIGRSAVFLVMEPGEV